MKRYGLQSLFIPLFAFCLATAVYADSLTLTTYYPAPFGAYSKIRLVPQTTAPDGTCTEGTMYMDGTNHIPMYCDDAANWVYIPAIWKSSSGQAVLSSPSMPVVVGGVGAAGQLQVLGGSGDPVFSVTRGSSNFGITTQTSGTIMGTSSSTPLDIRTANATRIYITEAGETQVQGGLSVVVSSGDSVVKLTNGGTTVYIGMKNSDGTVRISSSSTLDSATDFIYDPATGGVTINGPIYVKADGTHLGELKLTWIEAGADSGYYAMYAP